MKEGLVAEEKRHFALSEVEAWRWVSFDYAQDEGVTTAVGR